MIVIIHSNNSPNPRKIDNVQEYELDKLGVHILFKSKCREFYPWSYNGGIYNIFSNPHHDA